MLGIHISVCAYRPTLSSGPSGVIPPTGRCFGTLVPTSASLFYSAVSEEGSNFGVQPHFHPKSTEYFTVLGGKAHFELDGKKHVVSEGDEFVIPRGVVHKIWSPEGEYSKFKVKGDRDPVAERDFLMQMFTLVETVRVHGLHLPDAGCADFLKLGL